MAYIHVCMLHNDLIPTMSTKLSMSRTVRSNSDARFPIYEFIVMFNSIICRNSTPLLMYEFGI